jgi:hypothetical protein
MNIITAQQRVKRKLRRVMKSLKLSPSSPGPADSSDSSGGQKHEFNLVWQRILTARNENSESILEISFNLANEKR